MNKSVQFDGMRGLACLVVLIPHLRYFGFYIHESVAFGRFAQFGLFLFFFLSAYLLSRSIYRDAAVLSPKTWVTYAVRRIFRIVPLYYVVLLIDYFFFLFYFGSAGPHDFASLLRHITFEEGRSALWTMPVEMAFYVLLVPLMIFMGLLLRLPRGQKEAALVAAGAASFFWLAYILFRDRTSVIATWGVHEYAPYFVFGAVWSAIHIGLKSWFEMFPKMFWNIVGILALAFFLVQNPLWWQTLSPFNTWTYDPSNIDLLTFDVYLSWRTCGIVPIVLLMFLALESPSSWLRTLMSAPILVFVGKYSFGIYLLHMPVIFFVRDHITTQEQLGFGLVFLLVVPLAMLLYALVERPGITAGAWLIGKMEARPQLISPRPHGM